jgi:nicotinamidase-related amidase
MLLVAEQSLLLVVDVQTRLAAAMEPAALESVLHHAGLLLQASGALGVPVLATEQYPQGLGPTHEAIKVLLPAEARAFDKTAFSCCSAGGLVDAVNASGRRQIVLAGMETHVCVLQTAAELHQSGWQVFVVEDAVCSRREANKRNALSRLQQAGVVVTNTESVLFEWLRDARHPQFKRLAALVK